MRIKLLFIYEKMAICGLFMASNQLIMAYKLENLYKCIAWKSLNKTSVELKKRSAEIQQI